MARYKGLTEQEVQVRFQQYGLNELRDVHKVTAFDVLMHQIKGNSIIFLLAVAVMLSFVVGKTVTALTILVVIIVVVLVGFIQEYKAEKAINALKKMIMPVALVIRDGITREIQSNRLVPGDVVLLRTGEKIPADCKLLESVDLRINESVLTGESLEVKKSALTPNVEITDESRLFMGTYIVSGKAVVEVEHTGMNTRFGEIAAMISESEKELPLRGKINQISKFMVIVAISFSLITGMLTLYRAPIINGDVLVEILILVIAMSVSAFPEGFPMVLVSTLALGASRMAKQNAIVNRMSIIETLGETTVICTDKTGTITTGEMTVRNVFIHPHYYEVSGVGYNHNGQIKLDGKQVETESDMYLAKLLRGALMCNDSLINRTGEDGVFELVGTPTEGALLVLSSKAGMYRDDLEFDVIEEMPFSSERKMMSTLVDYQGERAIYAKGAPEVLIDKCSRIVMKGKEVPLTEDIKQEILEHNEQQTTKALRTLALAYRPVEGSDAILSEDDLIFIGLVGMEDPPREGVKQSIADTKRSGITVKLITGDNKTTAQAIAQEVGIDGKLIEGYQIESLTDEELRVVVVETSIFARVKPNHKLRIVRAIKENGEIVAMTGDGVNDAPALKEAHIGVAMGKNGTDVTRSVADLILMDDNFTTIVDAVREGRTIFSNLRKFTSYQLSCNAAELLILFIGVLIAPLLGWHVPLLLALQILFMNLVTDNLPAIALGFNPSSQDIMQQQPRKNAAILTSGLRKLIVFTALIMMSVTLLVYFISFNILNFDTVTSRTMALFALILMEIVGAYNFRSFRKKVLTRSPFVNRYLAYASIASLLATMVVIYSPINTVFGTGPIGLEGIIIGVIGALFFAALFDIIKAKRGVIVRDE